MNKYLAKWNGKYIQADKSIRAENKEEAWGIAIREVMKFLMKIGIGDQFDTDLVTVVEYKGDK